MKKENSLFLITAVLTLMIAVCVKHDDLYRVPVYMFVVTAAVIAGGNIYFAVKRSRKDTLGLWNFCSIGFLFTLVAIPMVHYVEVNWFGNVAVIGSVTVVAAVLSAGAMFFVLKVFKDEEKRIYALLFWAFLIRMFYVILAQAHYFQNDTGRLVEGDFGHLGYIYYLFENGSLPDVYWNQYYHPPLHHIVCALAMKVFGAIGVPIGQMDEVLQCVTLFYGTATLAYINKIGKEIGLAGKSRFVVVGIASFMPYGVMMSGALNNDSLMLLLTVMFIYYLICWYKNPSMWRIAVMALCMGGAMMTKFSAALVAPAAAVIMLAKAWQGRKTFRKYIGQFATFAVIVFPLGLWHTIRNIVKFDLTFGYVPELDETLAQYIGMYSGTQRLCDMTGQFEQLCLQWSNTEPNVSFNIPVSLIKFATFGESVYYANNSVVEIVGTAMFWLTIIVFLMMPIGLLLWFVKKDGQNIYKIFAVISAVTILFFYVKFCFDYPHICTMNVRYILPAVFMGCLAIGAGFMQKETTGDGHLQRIKAVTNFVTSIITIIYVIGCNLLILNLGLMM